MAGPELKAKLIQAGISESTYYLRMSLLGCTSERALSMSKEESKKLIAEFRNPFRVRRKKNDAEKGAST